MIIPLWNLLQYHSIVRWAIQAQWAEPLVSSCVALPIVCRLWYRVSDVLELFFVSKRFGFWPHITHVIVLTFKEIKHLSDCRIIGLSNCRSIELSDHQTIRLSDYRSNPLISVQDGAGSCVNIHIIVLAVNITFLFLITCLLVGECTYHKFNNTRDHWGMNFIGRRRRNILDVHCSHFL
jgi:hypothetical protein